MSLITLQISSSAKDLIYAMVASSCLNNLGFIPQTLDSLASDLAHDTSLPVSCQFYKGTAEPSLATNASSVCSLMVPRRKMPPLNHLHELELWNIIGIYWNIFRSKSPKVRLDHSHSEGGSVINLAARPIDLPLPCTRSNREVKQKLSRPQQSTLAHLFPPGLGSLSWDDKKQAQAIKSIPIEHWGVNQSKSIGPGLLLLSLVNTNCKIILVNPNISVSQNTPQLFSAASAVNATIFLVYTEVTQPLRYGDQAG